MTCWRINKSSPCINKSPRKSWWTISEIDALAAFRSKHKKNGLVIRRIPNAIVRKSRWFPRIVRLLAADGDSSRVPSGYFRCLERFEGSRAETDALARLSVFVDREGSREARSLTRDQWSASIEGLASWRHSTRIFKADRTRDTAATLCGMGIPGAATRRCFARSRDSPNKSHSPRYCVTRKLLVKCMLLTLQDTLWCFYGHRLYEMYAAMFLYQYWFHDVGRAAARSKHCSLYI